MVIITIITEENIDQGFLPYKHLNYSDRENLLEKTLFVVPSPVLLPNLHHLPHFALEKPNMKSLNTSLLKRDQLEFEQYQLQLLSDLISTDYQLVVLLVPPDYDGSHDYLLAGSPARSRQCTTPQHTCTGPKIFAGKHAGQTSPHMGFMLWDGRLVEVFNYLQRVQKIVKEGEFLNFKTAWWEDWRNRKFLRWRWLGN